MRFLLDDQDPETTFEESGEKTKPRRLFIIGLLLSVSTLSFTLAANISLGNNSAKEFGQGVLAANSCDPTIDIKPTTVFRNDTETPAMYVESFDLSNVSQSCSNKLFVLRAYPDSGTALTMNSSEPFKTLKFHFDSNNWVRDDLGCVGFENGVVNSIESNSVRVKLNSCIDTWYQYTKNQMINRPLRSNEMYRYTLETRPFTMAKIDVSSSVNGSTLGWAYNTGEGKFISYMTNSTSFPLYPDMSASNNFILFANISSTDFNDSAKNSNIYSVTTSANVSCIYDKKYAPSSQITTGAYANNSAPGMHYWVAYSCTTTGAGTVSFS